MKKVVCNVLYDTKMSAKDKMFGTYEMDLGLFEDEKSALMSQEIIKNILNPSYRKGYGLVFVNKHKVKEIFVPEDKMSNPMIAKRLKKDVNEFLENNPYVEDFVCENGQDGLQEIIGQAREYVSCLVVEHEDEMGD